MWTQIHFGSISRSSWTYSIFPFENFLHIQTFGRLRARATFLVLAIITRITWLLICRVLSDIQSCFFPYPFWFSCPTLEHKRTSPFPETLNYFFWELSAVKTVKNFFLPRMRVCRRAAEPLVKRGFSRSCTQAGFQNDFSRWLKHEFEKHLCLPAIFWNTNFFLCEVFFLQILKRKKTVYREDRTHLKPENLRYTWSYVGNNYEIFYRRNINR